MVLFNYAIREVTAKLVYYGPGLCGKTTNLQFIHEKLDPSARGKLLSLATDGDRTLFFDFLPIEMGNIGGYKVRFQLYTVPGQVHYNATRKLVLKGVDAVVFVADSQLSMVERNRESFDNLIENLVENGYEPAKVPIVIQLNKRDLPNIASAGDLVAAMGVGGYTITEAVAYRGDGVFETLKAVVKLTLSRLRNQFDVGLPAGGERAEAAPPPPPPPPPSTAFPASAPVAQPVPVPPPPPPKIEAAPEEISMDGLDEFDLADFSEEVPPPAPPGGARGAAVEAVPAAEDVVDLGSDQEILLEDHIEAAEEALPSGGDEVPPPAQETGFEPAAAAEQEWLVQPSLVDAYAAGGAGEGEGISTEAAEPPAWAVEMMADLERLRAENRQLREALRGITGLLDRQIDVLRDGRAELERHVGDGQGEAAP